MEFSLREAYGKGQVIATEDGQQAGRMTFNIPGTRFIIIDHTEVDQKYNGKGVGLGLLKQVVEMTRNKGIYIIPLCPFAKAMIQKHPEFYDVLRNPISG